MHCLSESDQQASHTGIEDGDPAVTFLPTSCVGHRYLLTIMDHSIRWFEAVPLADISAEVLEAFITIWVARFGELQRVTSDRGVQFTSGMWTGWCEDLQEDQNPQPQPSTPRQLGWWSDSIGISRTC